jgi:hypothetical protein
MESRDYDESDEFAQLRAMYERLLAQWIERIRSGSLAAAACCNQIRALCAQAARVRFCEQRRCFVASMERDGKTCEVACTGLTRAISYMMDADAERAHRIDSKSASRGKSGTVAAAVAGEERHAGREHGSTVHKQVDRAVRCLRDHTSYGAATPMDRCARIALLTCIGKGWLPVLPEFAFGSAEHRVASACDFIAIDVADEKLVVGELKVGYCTSNYDRPDDGAFASDAARLTAPMRNMVPVAYTHHVMQVVVSRAMLERFYGADAALLRTYIVRVAPREGQTYVHGVPEWAASAEHRANVLAALLAARAAMLARAPPR